MSIFQTAPPPPRPMFTPWIFPVLLLCVAYGLLGLTMTEHPGHAELMTRCVLMEPKRARIWSVAHVELGMAYFGVFGAMLMYALRAAKTNPRLLLDLGLAFAYLLLSFFLDTVCVAQFEPFVALLVGDAIVMTFTAIVSRQLWFQRLLGVFVPLVFFTCALGHFLEGLSFWQSTYPVNVPWTMVTADIGFAVLVNAARFPAFIRGHDILNELDEARVQARERYEFFRDVLLAATKDHLRLCDTEADLPMRLSEAADKVAITRDNLAEIRRAAVTAAREQRFPEAAICNIMTAVGEAALNAAVHGGGGTGSVCVGSQSLQIWIFDQGRGIPARKLPNAILAHSFITKDELGQGFAGQGFWLLMRTTDQVDLLTGPTGTTLVLTFHRRTDPDEALRDLEVLSPA